MAITTNTEYKVWANITASTWDSLITTLIAEAQGLAETITGYTWGLDATRVEYHNGAGNNVIVLKATPVNSIGSVLLLDAAGNTVQTLASTDYKVNLETAELRLTPEPSGIHFAESEDDDFGFTESDGPAFSDQFRNVKVTYSGGQDARTNGMDSAIWRIVDILFAQRGKDTTLKSESLGAYSYTNADQGGSAAYMAQVRAIVAPFERGHL